MKRLLPLLLLSSAVSPAFGWGRDGHRIIAELAQRQLTPAARAEASRLLAGEPEPGLPGVASWADDLRKADPRDRGSRLHYVNFRGGDCDYVAPRDCPNGECVIAAIDTYGRILADRHRSDGERRDALKYLVHFIGDVHQPLHSTSRLDHGGGDFQVSFEGRGTNLHALWDRDIVAARSLAPEAHAARLASQPSLPGNVGAAADAPVEWALESCRIVRDGGLYPVGHKLGRDYLLAHQLQAERRLREAGMRLAATLNAALAP